MISLFEIIGPVFAILALGYFTLSKGYLDASANLILPKYATGIAVPCLLFRSISQLDFSRSVDFRLIASYYSVGFICFLLMIFIARRYFARRPGASVSVGFSVLFGNTVFMGLPIAERAYGSSGLDIAYGIVSFHAITMYLIGSIAMESVSSDGKGAIYAFKQSINSLLKNPLVMSICAGFIANALAVDLPSVLASSMDLLAQTALPVGVFSIGAALTQYKIKQQFSESLVSTFVKLMLFPFMVLMTTYFMAIYFALPFEMARVAIIIAALPSGINIYLFATLYKRAEALAASVLLISTVLSLFTISFWLVLLDRLALYWPT